MSNLAFDWQRHPGAEKLCLRILDHLVKESAVLARLEQKIGEQTSGRLLDWVDHLLLPESTGRLDALSASGFERQQGDLEVWRHPGAQLPAVVVAGSQTGLALRVETIADFLQIHNCRAEIEGEPLSPYRRARVDGGDAVAFLVVERRGSGGFDPTSPPPGYLHDYFEALELWQGRPRGDEEESLQEAERLVERLVAKLGADPAAHIVCQAERVYWLSRNYAARVQKGRQDALGLGWGNQDHHTFRSSRRNFARLVELFRRLGFHRRERFYAGDEAGWGAQLMENATAGLTLFLDVDLAPEEIEADFSSEALPEREDLGTVGLWCALHGDSILGAGMHHLAAQFRFERLMEDLARHGVPYMEPFSNFPYLKQAFSVAERWEVDPQRIAKLVAEKLISRQQADRFLEKGAVGSHLENIERGEGYKGFNKKNVSLIIRRTDPRGGGS